MNKCFVLAVLILRSAICLAQQDNAYVKGRVIVFFKPGHLEEKVLNVNAREIDEGQLFKNEKLKLALKKHPILKHRKVIAKARPDVRFSVSRTGEQISIPPFHNMLVLDVPDSTNIPRLCKELNKLDEVIFAEPDFISRSTTFSPPPFTTPNDPLFTQQIFLDNPFTHVDINAKAAWGYTNGSASVKVAVIDSGIDYNNPDLGNGAYGPNAPKVKGGHDYYNADNDPYDDNGDSHGTAVAGIIGALSNNGVGVAGIAGGDASVGNNGVQLFALKVGGAGSDFTNSCVFAAIYDAATSTSAGGYGCDIINYSGTLSPSQYSSYWTDPVNGYRKAISYAAQNGVILVAAKGNNSSTAQYYPADFQDNLVISVGASDENDSRWYNSNYGNNMDVVAPGVTNHVLTTKRVASGNNYSSFEGTSASAPIVSGVAALLKSVNGNLHRDDVERLIEISAKKVGSIPYVNGYNDQMGYGRVDAGRALALLNAPYVLEQKSVTGGTVSNTPSSEQIILLNDAGNGLPDGSYIGKRYDVRTTVTIPASLCNEQYVWARTSGATLGWSAAIPNNQMGYTEVLSVSGNTVTLRTWVFYIQNVVNGQQINAYYPTDPSHVVFAYSTLINQPFSPAISGPGLICNTGAFTIPSLPANAQLSWTSSNPSAVSINASTGVVTRLNQYSGNASVSVTISGGCGSVPIGPKNFFVGNPLADNSTLIYPSGYSGTSSATLNPSATYNFTCDPVVGATSYNWILPTGFSFLSGNGSQSTYITTSSANGTYSLFCMATNSCGGSYTHNFTITIGTGGGSGGGSGGGGGGKKPCCPIASIAAPPFKFNMYPNPSIHSFIVNVMDTTVNENPITDYEVHLFDQTSKEVFYIRATSAETHIPVDNLPPNLYYLVIQSKEGVLKEELLIKR